MFHCNTENGLAHLFSSLNPLTALNSFRGIDSVVSTLFGGEGVKQAPLSKFGKCGSISFAEALSVI